MKARCALVIWHKMEESSYAPVVKASPRGIDQVWRLPSRPASCSGLRLLHPRGINPPWAPSRERSFGAAGSWARVSVPREPESAPRRPFARLTGRKLRRGPCAWRATAVLPNGSRSTEQYFCRLFARRLFARLAEFLRHPEGWPTRSVYCGPWCDTSYEPRAIHLHGPCRVHRQGLVCIGTHVDMGPGS